MLPLWILNPICRCENFFPIFKNIIHPFISKYLLFYFFYSKGIICCNFKESIYVVWTYFLYSDLNFFPIFKNIIHPFISKYLLFYFFYSKGIICCNFKESIYVVWTYFLYSVHI